MVIEICPHCNAPYSRMEMNTDFIHNCNVPEAATAMQKEDVLIIGTATDFDGTTTKLPAEVMMQGIENRVHGMRAGIEGEDVETVTVRGNPQNRFRSRTHFEYIDKSKK